MQAHQEPIQPAPTVTTDRTQTSVTDPYAAYVGERHKNTGDYVRLIPICTDRDGDCHSVHAPLFSTNEQQKKT